MTNQDEEAHAFLYKVCIETRNFEISQLVARNNFFMVFQGVLIAGMAQASATAPSVVAFAVCGAGVVASILQAFMASGAKFWQERWEYELEKTETRLLQNLRCDERRTIAPRRLFSLSPARSEKIVQARLSRHGRLANFLVRRYSVSKLPIYAGYFFLLFWVSLLLTTIKGPFGSLIPSFIVGFPTK